MADLSRMTAFRRVRRAVQDDMNVILSAGEGSSCLAENSGAPSMSECELSPGGSTSCSAVEVAPESCARLSCQPACAAGCPSSATPHEHPDIGDGTDGRGSCLENDVSCNGTVRAQVSTASHFELAREEQGDALSFRDQLRHWSIERAVPHDTVTHLLDVLRSHPCFSSLPKSARALLSTPRLADKVKPMGSGQYCHFGIAEGLLAALKKHPTSA